MNEQWTREEKETWNQKYYQSLDMSLKIYLAKLPPNRIPVLELETDENSWTKRLEKQGYQVHCQIKGLGENAAIRALYLDHARNAYSFPK